MGPLEANGVRLLLLPALLPLLPSLLPLLLRRLRVTLLPLALASSCLLSGCCCCLRCTADAEAETARSEVMLVCAAAADACACCNRCCILLTWCFRDTWGEGGRQESDKFSACME